MRSGAFTWTWTGIPNSNVVISAQAQWVDVVPGLGLEFSNANVGQVAVLSHAHACAMDVLPDLGPEFPNAITQ